MSLQEPVLESIGESLGESLKAFDWPRIFGMPPIRRAPNNAGKRWSPSREKWLTRKACSGMHQALPPRRFGPTYWN